MTMLIYGGTSVSVGLVISGLFILGRTLLICFWKIKILPMGRFKK